MNEARRRWSSVGLVGLIALMPLGCSGDNKGASTSSSDGAVTDPVAASNGGTVETGGADAATADTAPAETTSTTETTGPPATAGVKVAPLPPLPDPTPARACDGASVLCVDITATGASPDGTADRPFPSIADALGAAGSGATIQVAAGIYAEPVVIAGVDGLTLIGGFVAGGDFNARDPQADETVVEGAPDRSVVSITASSDIRVEGFRLTGGGGTTDTYSWYGGGVHIDYQSTEITIVGNRIDRNAVDHGDDPGATLGGGIASYGTAVSIIGNVIESNTAGRGSGISAQGETTIQGNTVRDNVSVGDHGGGMYLFGDVTVTANRVEGNSVGGGVGYGWGGGVIVYGDDTTAVLQGNVVTGNSAPSAGSAVFVDDGADATLIGELYFANVCAADGGAGMLVDSGGVTATEATLVNVTIAQHDCPNSSLGGQAVLAEVSTAGDPPPQVSVTNSIFWGNGGKDVASFGAEVTVTNSDVEDGTPGDGNISADPLFVDPAGGDFTLDPASPAVGLGATEATQP